MSLTTIHPDEDGEYSLTFSCGDLPSDPAAAAAGMEPNGHFWETVAAHVAPDETEELELDSEGSMFAAYGELATLQRLDAALTPLLESPELLADLISRAGDELSD